MPTFRCYSTRKPLGVEVTSNTMYTLNRAKHPLTLNNLNVLGHASFVQQDEGKLKAKVVRRMLLALQKK